MNVARGQSQVLPSPAVQIKFSEEIWICGTILTISYYLNLKLRRDRYNLQNVPRIQIERSKDIIKKIFHHLLFVNYLDEVNSSVHKTVNVRSYRPTFVYFSQATIANYLNALMFHFSSQKIFYENTTQSNQSSVILFCLIRRRWSNQNKLRQFFWDLDNFTWEWLFRFPFFCWAVASRLTGTVWL